MSSPEGENKCMHGVHVHVCAGAEGGVGGGGGGGGVISFSYYERGPGYFHWKIEEKQNQKKFLPVWFPLSCCITSDNLKF